MLAGPRGGKTEGPCSSSNRIAHRPRCCAYGSIDTCCRPLTAESLLSVPQSRVAAAKLHVPDVRAEHDALIAATASAHGLAVVMRNVGDFETTNAGLLNPWA